METTDKLRDWARRVKDNPHLGTLTEQGVLGLDAIAHGIEREVAERYMELPVDADGVPIRVGDTILEDYGEGERYRHNVTALIYTNRWDYEFDDDKPGSDTRDVGNMSDFYRCARHAKPRTVEDVLRDFAYKVCDMNNVAEPEFARYADEIRELMEVE